MKKISDAEYVDAVKADNRKTQLSLYEKLRNAAMSRRRSFGRISEEEFMDAFQDAFVILWESIEHGAVYVDDGRVMCRRVGTVSEVADLAGWFMGIVRNRCREVLRRSGNLPMCEPDSESEELSAEEDFQVRRLAAAEAVMSLTPGCRRLLTMFYIDRMSLGEIIETSMPDNTYNGLKTRKYKCLRTLRERYRMLSRTHESGN